MPTFVMSATCMFWRCFPQMPPVNASSRRATGCGEQTLQPCWVAFPGLCRTDAHSPHARLDAAAGDMRFVAPLIARKHVFTADKARSTLNWNPRPAAETIVDAARSAIAIGALT